MIPIFIWARLQLFDQFSVDFHIYEWFWRHYFMHNPDLHSFADCKLDDTFWILISSDDICLFLLYW